MDDRARPRVQGPAPSEELDPAGQKRPASHGRMRVVQPAGQYEPGGHGEQVKASAGVTVSDLSSTATHVVVDAVDDQSATFVSRAILR